MIDTINKFKEYFSEYSDQYVLIGGMACDIQLGEIGIDFRPTKDIDMVLIVEALTDEFALALHNFIEDGGYKARQRSTGENELYRFIEPTNAEYPYMVELFARPGNNVTLSFSGDLMPLHLSDEVSSLSAILLNEAYYEFLLNGINTTDGVSVLDAEHLVPMKMKAWLDLCERKERGDHVNEKDIRKHRQDVFRLFPLINVNKEIATPEEVRKDIEIYIHEMEQGRYMPSDIGIDISRDVIFGEYRKIYVTK